MAEKKRTISGGDSESDIGHYDVINVMSFPTDNYTSSSMNVSQISATSTDSSTQLGTGKTANLSIQHNISGVRFYCFMILCYVILCY